MRVQKTFYYTDKDYINREYTEIYKRVSRWIKIEYTIPRKEEIESKAYFRYNNKRYYLDSFLRCSLFGYSDKIKAKDGEEVQLDGCETENYYKPLFVELSEDCEYIRVYRYEGSEMR